MDVFGNQVIAVFEGRFLTMWQMCCSSSPISFVYFPGEGHRIYCAGSIAIGPWDRDKSFEL
jgi:hypothetical protein